MAVAAHQTAPRGSANHSRLADSILQELMAVRRHGGGQHQCSRCCPYCGEPHYSKIYKAVSCNLPIQLILPAFPGKSPNPNKVLGPLPDLAEELALASLHDLCQRIQTLYRPGAQCIICSDGRIFHDVVGMPIHHVELYRRELVAMIKDRGFRHITTFDFEDIGPKPRWRQLRDEILHTHGMPVETLQTAVRLGGQPGASPEKTSLNRMYRGITRFLVEDAKHPHQQQSNTAIQKDCRARAYEVIRRSDAWSGLLAARFPEAVRLSIHPQDCGSKKLGIRFFGEETWITPWHGVALKTPQGTVLVKKSVAEALGAELVVDDNHRPNHYYLRQPPTAVHQLPLNRHRNGKHQPDGGNRDS